MSRLLHGSPSANVNRPVASLTGASLIVSPDFIALHLFSGRGRQMKVKLYFVEEMDSQIGGRAFRLTPSISCPLADVEATAYDVLLCGRESSCTCPGHTYADGCKHLQAIAELVDGGEL
jgi:hypothetical protein